VDRLSILKALGDNTRYAIYLEVVRAPSPRSTGEVAETLGLHPNTVRPHLERMREVGLPAVEVDSKGMVGRPTHRYFVAADAPSLGLEPPAFPVLARMLVSVAGALGIGGDDVVGAGREQGRAMARTVRAARHVRGRDDGCVAVLDRALESLGFDPASETDADGTTIAFTHCPFRELAESHPEVVCHLHRGIVEGVLESGDGDDAVTVESFHTLADREPCQVVLSRR
jgi:predicted ArsR family transcriptional regulator